LGKGIPYISYTKCSSKRATIQRSQCNIWRNIDSSIRLFADGCVTYRKITNKRDRKFAEGYGHPGGEGEWPVENGMKINLGKSTAIGFTSAGG
jgi:hypothetical protein